MRWKTLQPSITHKIRATDISPPPTLPPVWAENEQTRPMHKVFKHPTDKRTLLHTAKFFARVGSEIGLFCPVSAHSSLFE